MIYVITGGSGSGKSEYAEQLVLDAGPHQRIYVATMKIWDGEGEARAERHRAMRAFKGFETVEWYEDLETLEIPAQTHDLPVVLLECMSNLAANEYERLGEKAADAVIVGIIALQKQCRHLMIVTNEVFSDGREYSRETFQYMELLGRINRYLGQIADSVTEVVYGIPIQIK